MKRKYIQLYNSASHKCLENTGDIMCKKLNDLKGRTAEDILASSRQAKNVPIDLDFITKELGIYKYPKTFRDIEKLEDVDHVSGLVLLSGNDIGIFYNKNDSIIQKRFTIAHEIGHCCLHGEILKNGYIELLRKNGFENQHETEASNFAARLLIPEYSLLSIKSRLAIPSLKGLADIFEVPRHLMEYRLKELKMVYYLDEKDTFVGA